MHINAYKSVFLYQNRPVFFFLNINADFYAAHSLETAIQMQIFALKHVF